MANPIKVRSRVSLITVHGDGVYTVTLEVPSRATRFRPGQFLHLTLDDFDPTTGYWPESRVFSIASPPRRDLVEVVYSVKGAYTQRMERELAVGDEVWLKLPYGSFIIEEDLLASVPVVLIAGGTGVSPFVPFLLANRSPSHPVYLFYGLRKAKHLLFGDEFRELLNKHWFRWHLFIEEGEVFGIDSNRGRLSIGSIMRTLGMAALVGHYFLSGPPAMIHSFRDDLREQGISAQQIHIDEWE